MKVPPRLQGDPQGFGAQAGPQSEVPLPLLPPVLRWKELSGLLGQREPGCGREGIARTGSLSGPAEPGQIKAGHALPGPTSHHQTESVGTAHGFFAGFRRKAAEPKSLGIAFKEKNVKWAKYSHPAQA